MSTCADRGWMYDVKGGVGAPSNTYCSKVDAFLDFAFSNETFVDGGHIKCPCSKCDNKLYEIRNVVKAHLYEKGFTPNYTTWWAHGETATGIQQEGPSSGPSSFDPNSLMEQLSGSSAQRCYKKLADDDEPLYDGCQTLSKYQAALLFYKWKVECNVSDFAYDKLLILVKEALPPSEKLVGSFDETKKILEKLGITEIQVSVKEECSDEEFYDNSDEYSDD